MAERSGSESVTSNALPSVKSFLDVVGQGGDGFGARAAASEAQGSSAPSTDASRRQHMQQYLKSAQRLEIHEAEALRRRFQAVDPDEQGLTPSEFERAAGEFLSTKAYTDPAILFSMFDTFNTGRVSWNEFKCGYAILCKSDTSTRVRYLFRMFDVHEDGYLNREQLSEAIRLIADFAERLNRILDVEVDGAERDQDVTEGSATEHGRNIENEEGHSGGMDDPGELSGIQAEDSPDLDSLVSAIVDGLLDGAETLSYSRFLQYVAADEHVSSWLESLSLGAGEYMQDSVVEMNPNLRGAYNPFVTRSIMAARDEAQKLSSRPSDSHESDSSDYSHRDRTRGHVDDPDNFTIDYGLIKWGKVIGQGSCATVWSAEYMRMPVAVKVFHQSDESNSTEEKVSYASHGHTLIAGDFAREIAVLKRMRHPAIVLYMGMCTSPKVCIVSELFYGGSVDQFLHGEDAKRFTPCQAHELLINVARGMLYLHTPADPKPELLHRDLKASNILVNAAATHSVICDFGLTHEASHSTVGSASGRRVTIGTPYTMAPEVIEGKEYTKAADVYSFGIVMWEVWTGVRPYEGTLPIQTMFAVVGGVRPPMEPYSFPQDLSELVQMCWAANPEDRPDFNIIISRLTSESMQQQVHALDIAFSEHEETSRQRSTVPKAEASDGEEKSRRLLEAVAAGDEENTHRLLAEGADANYRDYDRRTPLHLACAEGFVSCVKLLLEFGADPRMEDRWGGTPLRDAYTQRSPEVVRIIREALAERRAQASSRASSSDMTERVSPSDASDVAPVQLAAEEQMKLHESAQLVALFQLMQAVHLGKMGTVRSLLANGCNPSQRDYDERTALHIAASDGSLEMVKLLLEFGASPLAKDRWNSTPIDDARRSNHPAIAELLEKATSSSNEHANS